MNAPILYTKERGRMKMTAEQDKLIGRAFMTAMAKKLYREGKIDLNTMNRLIIKIEKMKR